MVRGTAEIAQPIDRQRGKRHANDIAVVELLGFLAELEAAAFGHGDAPRAIGKVQRQRDSRGAGANDENVSLYDCALTYLPRIDEHAGGLESSPSFDIAAQPPSARGSIENSETRQ